LPPIVQTATAYQTKMRHPLLAATLLRRPSWVSSILPLDSRLGRDACPSMSVMDVVPLADADLEHIPEAKAWEFSEEPGISGESMSWWGW